MPGTYLSRFLPRLSIVSGLPCSKDAGLLRVNPRPSHRLTLKFIQLHQLLRMNLSVTSSIDEKADPCRWL